MPQTITLLLTPSIALEYAKDTNLEPDNAS